MRVVILAVAFLSLLPLACGGGGGGDDGPSGPVVPRVTGLTPLGNQPNALANTVVQAKFNTPMKAATEATFAVHGSLTGRIEGTFGGADTALLNLLPDAPFLAGEEVEVTLTEDLVSTDGVNPAVPLSYRFRVAAPLVSGNPILASQVEFVGSEPVAVVTGDWDGDRDVDLAVASLIDSKVYLATNAAGIFTAAGSVDLTAGDNPTAIVAGDWDGDGDLDLAVVNSGPDTVAVLENDGGSFTVVDTVDLAPALDAVSITAGDFDGDGDLDLAVPGTGAGDHRLQILENETGAGDYSVAQTLRMGAQDFPTAIESADLDLDGDLDLLVGISGVPTGIRIFANLVSSGATDIDFVESTVFVSLAGTADPSDIAAADFDADGDIDFAVTNRGTNQLQIIRNDNLSFVTAFQLPLGGNSAPASLSVGDFDGDGDLDLATANPGNATFSLTLNHLSTNGIFAVQLLVGLQSLSEPGSLAAGDFDGDGDLDFAVTYRTTNRVVFLRNQ